MPAPFPRRVFAGLRRRRPASHARCTQERRRATESRMSKLPWVSQDRIQVQVHRPTGVHYLRSLIRASTTTRRSGSDIAMDTSRRRPAATRILSCQDRFGERIARAPRGHRCMDKRRRRRSWPGGGSSSPQRRIRAEADQARLSLGDPGRRPRHAEGRVQGRRPRCTRDGRWWRHDVQLRGPSHRQEPQKTAWATSSH